MRTSNVDYNPEPIRPYEPTHHNVTTLEGYARGAQAKFKELVVKLGYDANRFPTGFDEFAQARDCISLMEQVLELFKGPYISVASKDYVAILKDQIDSAKKEFKPVQYSEEVRRILFPKDYTSEEPKVTSRGSTPSLKSA